MSVQKTQPFGSWTYAALVFGAALGMFAGLTPTIHAAGGIFAKAVATEFGWGRSIASLSYSVSMLGLTIGSPLVGMLMDRYGIRRIIAILGVGYGIAVMCMSLQNGSPALWVWLSGLVGLLGASVSVVGYLAVLPQWFDRRLGLALALAMCGLGLGTTLMPQFAQYLVTNIGWRNAYAVLGAGSIPLTLLACAFIKERKSAPVRGARPTAPLADGMSFAEALRDYRLWVIGFVFLIAAACTHPLVPHLPALLADRGFSPADAARGASTLGIGLLAGRLVTGVLLDRLHARIVTLIFFVAGAGGMLLLQSARAPQELLLAAALVGLTIGAEGDLISYLVRKYFGLRAFGTLYGIAFSGYGLGAVIGPVVVGAYFDRYGSYDQPLIVMPCMLVAAGVLAMTLGRYRGAAAPQVAATSSLNGT
ncbi:MAG: MFS transporter [Dyella sp.]|nr:MFS transporter [Dyella sp.]